MTDAASEMSLTRPAAEALLREMLGRNVCLRADRRPKDLAYETYGKKQVALFRVADLKAWGEAHRHRGRNDPRGTALGDWLFAHGQSASAFAVSLGIGPSSIYRLIGHSNPSLDKLPLPNGDILLLVAAATKIDIGTIVGDAERKRRERNG
jgi:hypothetical protein